MKKRWFIGILVALTIFFLLILGLLKYIAPSKELTMDYTPIQLEDKLLYMVRNMKTELILTEEDINALIKMNMDRQPHKRIMIEGAHFSLKDNNLYADLNVILNGAVEAELHAIYAISWQEPELSLTPIELKLKDINLPKNLLKDISFALYEGNQTLIRIDNLYTKGSELVIKLKLNLFN